MIIAANKTITIDVDEDLKPGIYLVDVSTVEIKRAQNIFVVVDRIVGDGPSLLRRLAEYQEKNSHMVELSGGCRPEPHIVLIDHSRNLYKIMY